jgi:hypothetical protein
VTAASIKLLSSGGVSRRACLVLRFGQALELLCAYERLGPLQQTHLLLADNGLLLSKLLDFASRAWSRWGSGKIGTKCPILHAE